MITLRRKRPLRYHYQQFGISYEPAVRGVKSNFRAARSSLFFGIIATFMVSTACFSVYRYNGIATEYGDVITADASATDNSVSPVPPVLQRDFFIEFVNSRRDQLPTHWNVPASPSLTDGCVWR